MRLKLFCSTIEGMKARAFAAGVDMFLTEPLSMKRLDELIKAWREGHGKDVFVDS